MTKKFKPMAGEPVEPGHPLPMMVSPKLDGIRCVVIDGIPHSRNIKPIRNEFIQEKLGGLPWLDGELICGDPTATDVWNASNSGVMSKSGEPDFTFWVFDHVGEGSFISRYREATDIVASLDVPYIRMVPHLLCKTYDEIDEIATSHLNQGYEGSMLRGPDSPYKYGRSTVKEGFLFKRKLWFTSEAIVLGKVPLMKNTNEAFIAENGAQKRSKVKAGLVAQDTVGKLVCRDLETNEEFEIGSGLDDALRAKYWEKLPTIITYKHLGLTVNRKPRSPIFIGERDPSDMDVDHVVHTLGEAVLPRS